MSPRSTPRRAHAAVAPPRRSPLLRPPSMSLLLSLLGAACAGPPAGDVAGGPDWQLVHHCAGVSLRGLSVVDRQVLWASGTGGTVLRSIDGGASWQQVGPIGSGSDYRSVHAFDAECAVICSAGQPAEILRTDDGGGAWRRVFEDAHPAAFFDAIAFFDTRRGLVFGDPVDGDAYVLSTADAGRSWRRLAPATLPLPQIGEAGFAASGTCLRAASGRAWIATGGATSRLWRSADGGSSWDAVPLPLLCGTPAQGAFSVAFRDATVGVVVGGDYSAPGLDQRAAACTHDGGDTWSVPTGGIGGYRSGVAFAAGVGWIAVGSHGWSHSVDDGASWTTHAEPGFHAVAAGPGSVVWAAGSDGRIARLGSRR